MKKISSVLAAFLLIFALHPFSFAAGNDISPAIAVLREQTVMKKSALAGQPASFSKSEYENVIGAKIGYITVTSLPESGASLTLNGVNVANGQTVASSSLEQLALSCANGSKTASFSFRAYSVGWESTDIECVVDFSEKANMPPVLNGSSIECLKNVMCDCVTDVFEPDGDDVTFVIDEYPVSGTLKSIGGRLLYTPSKDFCGSDTFVIRALDEYGNSSEKAEFDINVENTSLVFADMLASTSHGDAIKLAESNVVSYIYRDGNYYFEPQKGVSRIDFLVMLMTGCGITPESGKVSGFTDTGTLTNAKKEYLAEAEKQGIVKKGDTFKPDDSVTRLDAAMWIASVVGKAENLSSLSDMTSLNSEEAACVSSVVQKGIFETQDNFFRPNDTLDKESAAHILFRVISLIE